MTRFLAVAFAAFISFAFLSVSAPAQQASAPAAHPLATPPDPMARPAAGRPASVGTPARGQRPGGGGRPGVTGRPGGEATPVHAWATPPLPDEAHPPRVLILARSPSDPGKAKMLHEQAMETGVDLEWLFVDEMQPGDIAKRAGQAHLVALDFVHPGQFFQLLGKVTPALAGYPGKFWPGTHLALRPGAARGLSAEQSAALHAYWDNGGAENFRRLFAYIRTGLFGLSGTIEPAIVLPENGLYHPEAPGRVFASLADYESWRPIAEDARVVGIGIHRQDIANDSLEDINALVAALEARGAVPLVYFDGNATDEVTGLLARSGQILPDVLATFTGMYASIEPERKWLAAIDRPLVQVMRWTSGYVDEWYDDNEGYPMWRMGVFYHFAEMSGRIDQTTLSARRRSDEQMVTIPEQLDALADRLMRYAALRHTPNGEKKVAVFVWNSPEGEDNFSASYLNVPRSVVELADAMRGDGYDIPSLTEAEVIEAMKIMIRPYYRTRDTAALEAMLAAGKAEAVPVTDYEAFLATLPEATREALKEAWEDPNSTYLTLRIDGEPHFVIPMWRAGNLVLLPQPLRGSRRADEKDIYHDKQRSLHHAYRAAYWHLVRNVRLDAIIHLGTHGTQEWASGKERGPWAFDDTQTTIGPVPVIYPYTTANVGEAQIAKRRGRAVTISHNSPPFAPAGLHGDLVRIHELMHQLGEMTGPVHDRTFAELLRLAEETGLLKDLGIDSEAARGEGAAFLETLHTHLHEIASLAQPLGLHTLGQTAKSDHVISTILQILGPDFVAIYHPDGAEELFAGPFEKLTESAVFRALRRILVEGGEVADEPEAARPYLAEAQKRWAGFDAADELQHILAALSARFVPAGPGNDPVRNPDALPMGRNLYGIDPRKIPTRAVWEAGSKLAADLVDSYRKSNEGRFPDKFAFSLWSTETLKHFGVVEAQILWMLGTRPKWNARGDVVGVEIVPAKELGRPRIDTVLQITGLYRDNLPEVMALLQKAINKVAEIEDETMADNPVRANTSRLRDSLAAGGMDADKAWRLARIRLFGNESGNYGSKLPDAVRASGSWDSEETLAKLYLGRLGWAFGLEADTRNLKLESANLFAENLRGTKAAVLSRSTNNHGLISLDHTFEYLGGLSLAVRHLDGTSPELFVSDLRNVRGFNNKTVAQFISQELRSRYFHPRYVAELKAQGFAGAAEMVKVTQNLWGWRVMDERAIRPDQWQEWYEVYVQDKLELGLKDWFEEVHPNARAQIAQQMLEAVRKGYWAPSEEVRRELVATWTDIASRFDVQTRNHAFEEYLAEQAAGFGLAMPAETAHTEHDDSEADETAAAMPPQEEQAEEAETVEGMRLEKVEPPAQPENSDWPWAGLLMAVMVLLGMGSRLAPHLMARRQALGGEEVSNA